MIWLLLGCGTYGLEGHDTVIDSQDSAPVGCEQAMCIYLVEPASGSPAGGTAVQISGFGFGLDPVVYFGNAQLDVTVLGTDRVQVTSPTVPLSGPVDITVEGGDGEQVVAYQGFVYSEGDADADSDTDSDTDSDVTPTGLVEGLVEYSYMVYGCPECVGASEQLEFGIAAVFHEPVSGSWLADLPPQGTCETSSASSPPVSSYKDLGEWAYVSAGSLSVSLRAASTGAGPVYQSEALTTADKIWNSAYDLQVPGAGWEVLDVMETSSGFDDIQPISILNASQTAFANMNRNGVNFTWAPSGQADSFIIWLSIYNSQGNALLGEVFCHTADNGGAGLPASMFTAYPSGALMLVQLMRREDSAQVNPATGNTIEGASYIGVVGTATLR